MDLKVPREWLEFPEDAEDSEGTTHRAPSTEELQTDNEDEQPFEEADRYETESYVAVDAEVHEVGDTGIVMVELVVPVLQRNLLASERRNRHRSNGHNRRSRRSRRSGRSRSRSRRPARSRSRSRRPSERHQDRSAEDTYNEEFGLPRPSDRRYNRHPTSSTTSDNAPSDSPRG
uniref:Uncharacterized protein n=1 Tax=Anopheles funestus TaxID=62324 RepID=A0A182S1A4_ANOFN